MGTTQQPRGVIELADLLSHERGIRLPAVEPAASQALVTEAVGERLSALGVQSFIGRPAFVGRSANGSSIVQFNVDGGSGYSSTWPSWAFETANTALVTSKKMWVLSNGDPFGSNLITTIVLAS